MASGPAARGAGSLAGATIRHVTELRLLTAGESHGPQLTTVVEGVPAGLPLDAARDIDPELRRRQGGHGRGKRQQIERDCAQIVGGVRGGLTLGSPLAVAL